MLEALTAAGKGEMGQGLSQGVRGLPSEQARYSPQLGAPQGQDDVIGRGAMGVPDFRSRAHDGHQARPDVQAIRHRIGQLLANFGHLVD